MTDVFLTYPTPEGSREIALDGDRISLGRGSDADLRFDDDGLSRLHATVHREGGKIWILDENSTNGTFVNGEKVPPAGTALYDGDRVKIGHYTDLRIRFAVRREQKDNVASAAAGGGIENKSPAQTAATVASPDSSGSPGILPVALTALAIFVIAISAAFIAIQALGGGNDPQIVQNTNPNRRIIDDNGDPIEEEEDTPKPSPKPSKETGTNQTTETNSNQTVSPEDANKNIINSLPRKKFSEMSEAEKDEYVKAKAEKIARIIGNQTSEPIPPEAVRSIRGHLKGYIDRVRAARVNNCGQGAFTRSDMTTVMERASRNAPFILRAFYAEGLDPQIGLYVAMIESEHCPCLQSPTGALGMFQFVRGTGREYNLQVKSDASPSNPDQRCDPEPAARAAAQYLKYLTGRFGTGPMSFPLAIASYNSGQGGLSQNLEKALKAAAGQDRSFWTLVANQVAFEGGIGEQFRRENVKYVPKFFAAAIIGENPRDFGIDMQPLSTYTK
ncbi:MAG TPA: FHA domain-containing protein [Pyrinomonadaceae bacterium]|nr:FHA domain-containing protein [Pyrinomonadaceae bacterium]